MKRTLERIFTELEYGMRILSLKILRRYVIFFLRLMVRNGRKYGNVYVYEKKNCRFNDKILYNAILQER